MADIALVAFQPSAWYVNVKQTNALATATKAAVLSRRHFITGFSISMSAVPATTVEAQVLSGATVIDAFEIPALVLGPMIHNFPRPWKALNVNEAMSITLPALGAGVVGSVTLRGFTTQD